MILPSVVQRVNHPLLNQKEIHLDVKRDDLISSGISGNKYRKLSHNLRQIKADNKNGILTFGGAFSNHINAVAKAGKIFGLETVGIIRGELDPNNPTLRRCIKNGMRLIGISRTEYRRKEEGEIFKTLQAAHPTYQYIPEGGSNALALKGVGEIVDELHDPSAYNYICVSAGTGGTAAGIHKKLNLTIRLLAFAALKGDFLYGDILRMSKADPANLLLIDSYHFGGYAKTNAALITAINEFYRNTGIPTDPIYNGKLIYGLLDLIAGDFFPPACRILWIHTGGLQGIEGYHYLNKGNKVRIIMEKEDLQ